MTRTEARERFGLDPDRPTLLVSGGSQGARAINQALSGALPAILDAGIQVLHVLGAKNFSDADVVVEAASGARYVPVAYVDAMIEAYLTADLMIGRAGAGTVMETAVLGLPVVFIPLPWAMASRHVTRPAWSLTGQASCFPRRSSVPISCQAW